MVHNYTKIFQLHIQRSSAATGSELEGFALCMIQTLSCSRHRGKLLSVSLYRDPWNREKDGRERERGERERGEEGGEFKP